MRPCVPPPSGLISWFPGDGDTNDVQGGNNGTLQNGATFAPGMVGQAFSFNGTDASMFVHDSPSLRLGASDFTIDFWLNTTQTTFGTLLWKTSCDGPCLGWAVFKRAAGEVEIQVCQNGCQQWQTQAQTRVDDGQWHHVALTRSGTTLKAYLDGRDDTVVA